MEGSGSDSQCHFEFGSQSAKYPDSQSSDTNKYLIKHFISPRYFLIAKTSVENMRITLAGFSFTAGAENDQRHWLDYWIKSAVVNSFSSVTAMLELLSVG